MIAVKNLSRQFHNIFAQSKIFKIITQMEPNSAPGPNSLSAKFYKMFCSRINAILSWVVSACFEAGRIPGIWHHAIVTLIHKKKDRPQLVENYRAISLMNVDANIYERCLLQELLLF